jgi:hypothetical protein
MYLYKGQVHTQAFLIPFMRKWGRDHMGEGIGQEEIWS